MDHRMAMSLSLLSLKTKKISIIKEECVRKSFPNYFNKLESLGFNISYKSK